MIRISDSYRGGITNFNEYDFDRKIPMTRPSAEWCNHVQEEICGFIESENLKLTSENNQFYDAILKKATSYRNLGILSKNQTVKVSTKDIAKFYLLYTPPPGTLLEYSDEQMQELKDEAKKIRKIYDEKNNNQILKEETERLKNVYQKIFSTTSSILCDFKPQIFEFEPAKFEKLETRDFICDFKFNGFRFDLAGLVIKESSDRTDSEKVKKTMNQIRELETILPSFPIPEREIVNLEEKSVTTSLFPHPINIKIDFFDLESEYAHSNLTFSYNFEFFGPPLGGACEIFTD